MLKLIGALAVATVVAASRPSVSPPESGYRITRGGDTVVMDVLLNELSHADVVFVGEEHDDALGHKLELEILNGLAERRPKTVLSLEMFERDVQPVVDEYLGGFITESQFLASSRPWPNYKTDYRPLVEFCRQRRLVVVAANAPRRYVNMVSRGSPDALAALPRVSKSWLAPLPYSQEVPAGYAKMLGDLFSQSHGAGGSGPAAAAPPSAANMMAAQYLWDATMANSIERASRSHRGALILQVNGSGHSDHGWGIVDRLRRSNPRLKVRIVSIKRDSGFPDVEAAKYADAADYVILSPSEKRADSR